LGRKKTPTKLKIIKGTNRKDRQNKKEPVVPIKIPSAPDHLSKEALIEWDRVSNQLYKLGLLTDIDMAALAGYCDAYGMWVKSRNELNSESLTIETTNGNIIQNPLVGIVNQSREHMRKFLTEFGLSPASRAKVTAKDTDKEKDEWDEY
jgi:P27 family predicted phage terminase small subunit